jgi:predicted MFS family arabinose efflux permease
VLTRTDAPIARSLAGELVFASALMLAMFSGNLPQYTLGVLAPVLIDEVAVGEAQLGVLASMLYVSAAVVARLAGRRIDRVSGRLTLGLLFSTATGALVVIAGSHTWKGLLAAVLLAGVAIGANNLATNRLIAIHVPDGRRGLVIGVKQTGVKLAHVAAGAAVPVLAVALGWRRGLLVLAGGVAIAAALSLQAVPRHQPVAHGDPRSAAGRPSDLGGRVRWLRYYAGFMGVGMSAITTYLPLHAVQNVGLSLVGGGLVVTLLGTTAMVARLIWATVAERSRQPATVLAVLGIGGGLSLAAIAMAPAVGPWLLWLGAATAGATAGSWNVVAHLTVVSEIEPERAAAATGLVQATFLIGLAVGAPLFGVLVESTGSFELAWLVAGALSGAALATASRERIRRQVRPA